MTFPKKSASNLKQTWTVQPVCNKLELSSTESSWFLLTLLFGSLSLKEILVTFCAKNQSNQITKTRWVQLICSRLSAFNFGAQWSFSILYCYLLIHYGNMFNGSRKLYSGQYQELTTISRWFRQWCYLCWDTGHTKMKWGLTGFPRKICVRYGN